MPLMEDLYAKERARQVSLVPFFYSQSFQNSVLTAGATITQTTNINGDAHFVVRALNITVYAAGLVIATATSPLLINLFDTVRPIQDNPQPIQNLCGGVAAGGGNGLLPGLLVEPWLVRAAAAVQIAITNLGAASVPRADVTLAGFKVYKFGAVTPADL
jgi:hypothetical protein